MLGRGSLGAVLGSEHDGLSEKIDWLESMHNASIGNAHLPDPSNCDIVGKDPNLVSGAEIPKLGSTGCALWIYAVAHLKLFFFVAVRC